MNILKQIKKVIQWMFNLSWKIKIFILIIIALISWYGYTKVKKSGNSTAQIQTEEVARGTLVISVSASGTVTSANSAAITTQASGVIKNIFSGDGESLKAGQKILEIELDESSKQKYSQAAASYQSAKNSLDSAKANLWTLQSKMFSANQKFMTDAVNKELATTDPTYIQQDADWLAAEAAYKNQENVIKQAQTSVNSAWLSLQQASPIIYAPISGKIVGLSLQKGSVIGQITTSTTTSQQIGYIQTDALPTVSINLTEIDIAKVKVGNKATITLDAYQNKTFTGSVFSIDTIGSVSSGVTSYPVVINFDHQTAEIFSNMAAQVSIITETKDNVLLVSNSALQTQNGENYVRLQKDNQIEEVVVTTGLSSDTQTEIVSGLNEGDVVVLSVILPTQTDNNSQSPFGMFGGSMRSGEAVRVNR